MCRGERVKSQPREDKNDELVIGMGIDEHWGRPTVVLHLPPHPHPSLGVEWLWAGETVICAALLKG